MIDMAPVYNVAEAVVGEAFEGSPPPGTKFTTKVMLGDEPTPEACEARCRRLLTGSLNRMKL